MTPSHPRRSSLEVLRKVRDLRRRAGLAGVAFRVAQRAAQRAGCDFELYDVYVAEDSAGPGDVAVRGWFWRWLGEGHGDVEDLLVLRPDSRLYRARLAEGYRCAVARDGATGAVIAMAWYHGGSHQDQSGVRIPIGAGDVWAEDAVVRPDWRGRGVYPTLSRLAFRELRDTEGVARIVVCIDVTNRASRRAARKRGAEPVRRIMTLRLGPYVVARDGRRCRLGRTPLALAPVGER